MIDLMFMNGQKIQLNGDDVIRTFTQTADKIFTFKKRKIQRMQRGPVDGASI